ncbi:MAG: MlaD family protein [Gemmatimonadota bacterium]|jgi:phospholipid/cholesterol/gamma-HCH transport system substrate-binding protein
MTDNTRSSGRRRPSDEEIAQATPSGGGGREVRVGIFVLAGLISFIAVLFLLTDPATLRGRYILFTQVENAGGIRRGDPIQMRGVNVGRIHGFEMEPDERVAISMEMDGEWKIPADSRTELGASGIFGGRTLEVIPGSSDQVLQPGDTLPGSGGESPGIMGSVDQLGTKAGDVLDRINALLDTGTVASVQGSARELDDLLTDLSAVTREQNNTLRRLTTSLAATADGLEASTPDVQRALARADSAMETLTRTGESLDRASTSLRSLLERMDRGEGTLGKLARDDSLYLNMNRAAESIAALVDDIRANPRKYINVSIF